MLISHLHIIWMDRLLSLLLDLALQDFFFFFWSLSFHVILLSTSCLMLHLTTSKSFPIIYTCFSCNVLPLLGVACLNPVKTIEVYGSLQIMKLAFLKAWRLSVLQPQNSHCHPPSPTSCFHVERWMTAYSKQDPPILEKVSASWCLFKLRGLTGPLPPLFGGPWCEEEHYFMEVILKIVLEG